MADEHATNPQREQAELFPVPDAEAEEPQPSPWFRDRTPAASALTVPEVSQAPADWSHATWLRSDCRDCEQFSEWVFTAEDGNAWDVNHMASTGHRRFYSYTFSRITFESAEQAPEWPGSEGQKPERG